MRSTVKSWGSIAISQTPSPRANLVPDSACRKRETVFVSVKDADKDRIIPAIQEIASCGFNIVATREPNVISRLQVLPAATINKVLEGRPHIVDAIKNGEISIVFNTTDGTQAIMDSKDIRRTALLNHIPYYTTLAGAIAVTQAIRAMKANSLDGCPHFSPI